MPAINVIIKPYGKLICVDINSQYMKVLMNITNVIIKSERKTFSVNIYTQYMKMFYIYVTNVIMKPDIYSI